MILAHEIVIPDSLLWWHIALMIIGGGAITVWGIHGIVQDWLDAPKEDRHEIMTGDLVALSICLIFGGLVGWRVFDWVLGGAFGLLGGIGYKLFMKLINKFLKKKGLNGNGK